MQGDHARPAGPEYVGGGSGQEVVRAMPGAKISPIGWTTWLAWILANVAVWAVSGVLLRPLAPFFSGDWSGLALAVAVLIAGMVLGAAQWLVLRRWVNHICRWIPVSLAGVLIAAFPTSFFQVLDLTIGPGVELDPLLSGAAFGIALGTMQWLVLRRRVHRAGWWILTSGVGWSAGFFVGEILATMWGREGAGRVYDMGTGVVAGATTAFALL